VSGSQSEGKFDVGTWTSLLWTVFIAGGLLALYGLHRLGLWMEERGYIYYVHKKPTGSAAGSFVALQKIIEPQAQHVIQVARVNHLCGDEQASGQDDPENRDAERSDESGVREQS
jgi:hypothetical protein